MSETARIPYCCPSLGEAERASVIEVLKGGWIARGSKAREFEAACAGRLGASHALCCSNGSAALEIALRGLGIGPGDEVIVPTLTWVATAMAVRLVGADPVFADVDPFTHNVTPETVLACWSERTRAVIGVDFAGIPHDAPTLRMIAEQGGAHLVQDAAHSFGARYQDGSPVGNDSSAHVTTFSFHPAKTITTAEGGLVTCADASLAERMRRIRSGGVTRDFEESRGGYDFLATEVGSNFHMTELQAALGLAQLPRTDELVRKRKRAAKRLLNRLAPFRDRLGLPVHPEGSSWNLFIVELRGERLDGSVRDQLIGELHDRGVAAHVHYPLLHRQPIFQSSADELRLTSAVRYERRALTLPLFADITDSQIDFVANAVAASLETIYPKAKMRA